MKISKSWLYVFFMLIESSSLVALSMSSQSDVTSFTFNSHVEVCEEFQHAAWCGDLVKFKITYIVLRRGIRQDQICSALRSAALKGHANIIRFLLRMGVDANQQVLSSGEIALHDAAMSGCVDVIDCLVAGGGDVNVANINGSTPLYGAVYRRELESVKRLIGYGANMHAQNKYGKSPLQTATRAWRTCLREDRQVLADIIRYMVLRGAPIVEGDSDVIDAVYKNKHILNEEQEAVGKALEEISSMTRIPQDLNRLFLSFLSAHLRMPNSKMSTRKQKLRGCLDAALSSLYAWWHAR